MLGPAVDEGLIRLPHNGWRPRAYQTKRWHFLEKGGKRAVAISHRCAGKHEVCLHWSAIAAHLRVGVYWHMLPETNQERKAVWDAVNPHSGQPRINEAFPRELRETDMAIRFPDLQVMMVTAMATTSAAAVLATSVTANSSPSRSTSTRSKCSCGSFPLHHKAKRRSRWRR